MDEVTQPLERAKEPFAHRVFVAAVGEAHLHRDRDVSHRYIAWLGVWAHGRGHLHRCEQHSGWEGKKNTHTHKTKLTHERLDPTDVRGRAGRKLGQNALQMR